MKDDSKPNDAVEHTTRSAEANDADNRIAGGSGDDNIRGFKGNDEIDGGRGDDLLEGNDGDDNLEGGAGDDILYGGVGADKMTGGTGGDVFVIRMLDGGANAIGDFHACEDRIQPVFSRSHLSQVFEAVTSCFGGMEKLDAKTWDAKLAQNERYVRRQLKGSTFRRVGDQDLEWTIPPFRGDAEQHRASTVTFNGFYFLNPGLLTADPDGVVDSEAAIELLLRQEIIDLGASFEVFGDLPDALDLTRTGERPVHTTGGPGGSEGWGARVTTFYGEGDAREVEINHAPHGTGAEAVRINFGRLVQRVDVTVQRFYGSEAGGNVEALEWIAMVQEMDGAIATSRPLHRQRIDANTGAFSEDNPGEQTFVVATDEYFTHLVLIPLAYDNGCDSSDFILSKVEVITAPRCCKSRPTAVTLSAEQIEAAASPGAATVDLKLDDALSVTVKGLRDHLKHEKEPRALTFANIKADGDAARRRGMGVAGANNSGKASQIGYNTADGTSEGARFEFSQPLISATVSVSNLFRNESGGLQEQLRWTALRHGRIVGDGVATTEQLADVIGGDNPHRGDLHIGSAQHPVGSSFDVLVMSATDYAKGPGDGDSSDYWITDLRAEYCAATPKRRTTAPTPPALAPNPPIAAPNPPTTPPAPARPVEGVHAEGAAGQAGPTLFDRAGAQGKADADEVLRLRGASLTSDRLQDTIVGSAGADRLRGRKGDDTIAGGAGNDVIEGNRGADTLEGGAGDDVLFTGMDSGDRMTGGAGHDVFLVRIHKGGTGNRITDFQAGDTIALTHKYPSQMLNSLLSFKEGGSQVAEGGAKSIRDAILESKDLVRIGDCNVSRTTKVNDLHLTISVKQRKGQVELILEGMVPEYERQDGEAGKRAFVEGLFIG